MTETRCTCTPETRKRRSTDYSYRPYHGYGLAVVVRVHFGDCPQTDEVLEIYSERLEGGPR